MTAFSATTSRRISIRIRAVPLLGLLALAACGGGGGGNSPTPPVPTYTIGGGTTGLLGSGLVLQINGSEELAVGGDGTFTFPTALAEGATYSVAVKTPPSVPKQLCTVSNGNGTVSGANVSTIAINCALYVSRFAYVANQTGNSISAYGISSATGELNELALPVDAGSTPRSIAVDPSGKYAYVASAGSDRVYAYNINADGTLSALGNFEAGDGPTSVAIDPSGSYVYVANGLSDNISVYRIGADGTLTGVLGSPFSGGDGPASITVHPQGKFLYVANQDGRSVSVFEVGATGALTPSGGNSFGAGMVAFSIAIHPAGRFAYVANPANSAVSAYEINLTTGALSALADSPFGAGTSPGSVAIDPFGKFAFVGNSSSNNISVYSIGGDGKLTPVARSPFTSVQPRSLSVDAAGARLYVANLASDQVSTYTIDASSGALAAVTGGTIATGDEPVSVVTTP